MQSERNEKLGKLECVVSAESASEINRYHVETVTATDAYISDSVDVELVNDVNYLCAHEHNYALDVEENPLRFAVLNVGGLKSKLKYPEFEALVQRNDIINLYI